MAIYLCTLLLLLTASFIRSFARREIEINIANFLFLMGFSFSLYTNMFRNMIGGYDVFVYAFYFENIEILGNYFNYEMGFYYFTKLIYAVSSNRFFYFSSIAIIYTFFSYIIAHRLGGGKYSYFVFFLIFCKFYFYSFVYLRQVIAVVLVWYGVIHLSKENKKAFVFYVILGSLFHISALISLIFLFFNRVYKVNTLLFIFIISAITPFVPLDKILMFVSVNKFNDYLGRDFNFLYLIESIIVFILLLSQRKVIVGLGKKDNFYFNMAIFYVCFNVLVSYFSGFSRFSWYPFIGVVVFLGCHLMQRKNNLNKAILFFLISLYFIAIFLRIMIMRDGGDMMPYESIFSESIRNSQFGEIGN